MVVHLRCYAELNDHLPPAQRQRENAVALNSRATVAELLRDRRFPSEAIELVLVNGASCGFSQVLRDGDRVSLYPVFEALDVTSLLRLRSRPLRKVLFVADAHLGRLARYLRLVGFDTLYENDPGDTALVEIAAAQGRILLSRDRALLARPRITHGLWVPQTAPREQLTWLVERLDLNCLFRPFTRCMGCNGLLSAVDKDDLKELVPQRVLALHDAFWRCGHCAQIYWRGTHYERLRAFVERLSAARQKGGFV